MKYFFFLLFFFTLLPLGLVADDNELGEVSTGCVAGNSDEKGFTDVGDEGSKQGEGDDRPEGAITR